jgi:hypothetical protein
MSAAPHARFHARCITVVIFLAIALSLTAGVAAAAEPTREDMADFERMFGLDHILATMPKTLAEASKGDDMTPDQRACMVARYTARFTARVEGNLARLVTHESVADWRAFAATGAGRKLVAYLQEGMTASVDGRTPPDREAFKAGLTDAEAHEITLFVRSPAADVMKNFNDLTAGIDTVVLSVQVAQECGVMRQPSPTSTR